MMSPLQSSSPRYPQYTTSLARNVSNEEQQNSPMYSHRENLKSLKMRTPSSNNVYTSYNNRPQTTYLNHEGRGFRSGGRLHSQQIFNLRKVHVGSPNRAKSITQLNLNSPRQAGSAYSIFNQHLLNTDYYLYDQQGLHERKNMFQNLHTCLSSKRMKTLNDEHHHPSNNNAKYLPNLQSNTARDTRTAPNTENLTTLNSHRGVPPLADIKLTTSKIIISSPRQSSESKVYQKSQKREKAHSRSKKVGDNVTSSYLNTRTAATNSELNSWHENDEVSNNNTKNVSTTPSHPNGSLRSTPNKFRISTLPA